MFSLLDDHWRGVPSDGHDYKMLIYWLTDCWVDHLEAFKAEQGILTCSISRVLEMNVSRGVERWWLRLGRRSFMYQCM